MADERPESCPACRHRYHHGHPCTTELSSLERANAGLSAIDGRWCPCGSQVDWDRVLREEQEAI